MVRAGVGADGNSEDLIPRPVTEKLRHRTNVAPRTATSSGRERSGAMAQSVRTAHALLG
jgi:hypothetical protein